MRKTAIVLVLALLLVLPFVGCKGLDAKLTGPAVFQVAERHDEYVRADQVLEPVQKKAMLQTTEMIRKIWVKAGYEPEVEEGGK